MIELEVVTTHTSFLAMGKRQLPVPVSSSTENLDTTPPEQLCPETGNVAEMRETVTAGL